MDPDEVSEFREATAKYLKTPKQIPEVLKMIADRVQEVIDLEVTRAKTEELSNLVDHCLHRVADLEATRDKTAKVEIEAGREVDKEYQDVPEGPGDTCPKPIPKASRGKIMGETESEEDDIKVIPSPLPSKEIKIKKVTSDDDMDGVDMDYIMGRTNVIPRPRRSAKASKPSTYTEAEPGPPSHPTKRKRVHSNI